MTFWDWVSDILKWVIIMPIVSYFALKFILGEMHRYDGYYQPHNFE